MINPKFLFVVLFSTLFSITICAATPTLNTKLNSAYVKTYDNKLFVGTGLVERVWEFTENGLSTISIKNNETSKVWHSDESKCDWSIADLTKNEAELISLNAVESNDEGFTSEHICVTAEYYYPSSKLSVKYQIWAFPNAPGLRTQLFLKGDISGSNINADNLGSNGYIDRLPVDASSLKRSYIGYYNDTQHRNTVLTPLIKEEILESQLTADEIVDWSNIVAIDDAQESNGIMMVKESHKCVNQKGVNTGGFTLNETGAYNWGEGLALEDIQGDRYSWCWASWSIVYSGEDADRQLALKKFDRARYPIDPARDIYIQANTWGSGSNKDGSKLENVLRELEIQKELGVDIQQIDDGWQVSYNDWNLREDWYPNGWSVVRQKAQDLGVKLGLWGAATSISLDVLKNSYNEGGFVSYKLDFAHLTTHKSMDKLMTKVRDFVKYTDHKVRVNWDLTENNPRFGYYWAKEYGCVYLENRKPKDPVNVIYVPSLVLRDCWQLSKYTNINKFQTSIQNCAMTDSKNSDAYLHTQSYATAIGLSGVPLLFMETYFLDKGAISEMKEIFAKYKTCREEMFKAYVFPIGDTPNNANWAGFQYKLDKKGYLLLFREINNKDNSQRVKMEFVKDKKIKLVDIMSGERITTTVNSEGYAEFNIEKSGDFRLYRYTEK